MKQVKKNFKGYILGGSVPKTHLILLKGITPSYYLILMYITELQFFFFKFQTHLLPDIGFLIVLIIGFRFLAFLGLLRHTYTKQQ